MRVLLIIDGWEQVVMASSFVLKMASPGWSKFLFPLWEVNPSTETSAQNSEVAEAMADLEKEATNPDNVNKQITSVKQIDCREDHPSALSILLHIAHLEFQHVPTKLEFGSLYNMAILVDQYQCVNLVEPWLEGWLADE